MSATKILWDQVLLVSFVVLAFLWGATEWVAWRLAGVPEAAAIAGISVPTLKAVAQYTREHSSAFVTDGPRRLTPDQRARRQQKIEAPADKLASWRTKLATVRRATHNLRTF